MKYKLIGIYELITGAAGFVLIIISFIREIILNESVVYASFFLGIILFSLLGYSGYALIKGKKHGRKYSIALQALQIFGFTYAGTKYVFCASAFFSFIINNRLHFKISPDVIAYSIEKVPEMVPFELRIYILPVIILLLMLSRRQLSGN